jgi:hypothetical protein
MGALAVLGDLLAYLGRRETLAHSDPSAHAVTVPVPHSQHIVRFR